MIRQKIFMDFRLQGPQVIIYDRSLTKIVLCLAETLENRNGIKDLFLRHVVHYLDYEK